MPKPLLTDEMIAAAKQESKVEVSPDLEPERIVKSRRIENAKRQEFQSKLNRILWLVLLLLAALFYAIFKL